MFLVTAHGMGVINLSLGICGFVFAALIITKTPVITRMHIGLSLVGVAAGIWSVFSGVGLLNHNHPDLYLLWNRLNFTSSFIVAAVLLLSYYVYEKKLGAASLAAIFLPAALFLAAAFTKYGVIEVTSIYPLVRKIGPFNYFYRAWMFIVFAVSIYNFTKGYRELSGSKKLQLQYIFIGVIFSLIIGTVFGAIVPSFGNHTYINFLPVLPLIYYIAVGYAVLKRSLLGMEIVAFDIARFIIALCLLLVLNRLFYVTAGKIFIYPELFSSSLSLIIVALFYFATPVEKKFANAIRNVVLNKRVRYQKLLSDCTKAVTSILEIDKLLNYVTEALSVALGPTKIAIFLRENIGENELLFKLYISRGLDDISKYYLDNRRIIQWIEEHRKPFIVDMLRQSGDKNGKNIEVQDFLSTFDIVLVIPLIYKDKITGIITLDQKRADGSIFDIDDIEMLDNLAGSLSVALENARLYTTLNDAYMDITRSLAVAVETRDPFMVGHSENVTKYALAISNKLKITGIDLIHIIQAAMLHDLGKIGIHDYILSKSGKLTPEEWVEMKLHTVKGSRILEPLPFMKEVSVIIRYHHERFDGGGYPEGFSGDQIPLGSQILAVADAFDAMISPRVYRITPKKKFTVEQTIEELINNRGTQFNPKIVDIFLDAIKENPNLIRLETA